MRLPRPAEAMMKLARAQQVCQRMEKCALDTDAPPAQNPQSPVSESSFGDMEGPATRMGAPAIGSPAWLLDPMEKKRKSDMFNPMEEALLDKTVPGANPLRSAFRATEPYTGVTPDSPFSALPGQNIGTDTDRNGKQKVQDEQKRQQEEEATRRQREWQAYMARQRHKDRLAMGWQPPAAPMYLRGGARGAQAILARGRAQARANIARGRAQARANLR